MQTSRGTPPVISMIRAPSSRCSARRPRALRIGGRIWTQIGSPAFGFRGARFLRPHSRIARDHVRDGHARSLCLQSYGMAIGQPLPGALEIVPDLESTDLHRANAALGKISGKGVIVHNAAPGKRASCIARNLKIFDSSFLRKELTGETLVPSVRVAGGPRERERLYKPRRPKTMRRTQIRSAAGFPSGAVPAARETDAVLSL